MHPRPRRPDPLTRFLLRHFPTTVILLGAVAVVVKLLIVARGDAALALAIMVAAPIPTVLLGGLVSVAPATLVAATALAFLYTLSNVLNGRTVWPSLMLVGVIAAVAGIATPLLPGLLLALFLTAYAVVHRVVMGRSSGSSLPLGPLLIGAIVWTVIAYPVLWVPREEVLLQGEDRPTLAWVLDAGAEWTTLLVRQPLTVQIVETESVESRQPCRAAGTTYLTGMQLITGWRSEMTVCSQ